MKTKIFTLFIAFIGNVGTIFAWSGTCGESLTWSLNTKDSTLTIKGSGAMTNWEAYYNCPWHKYRSYIKHVSLPDGLSNIGNYAFKECSSLTSIDIPNSVTIVGHQAFYNCTGLISATIGNSVTSIGDEAFVACSSLTSVLIGNSVTSIGQGAFYYCTSLTSINIPNSVTSIECGAFGGCNSLPIEDNLRYADTYLVEAVDKSLSTYTIKQGTTGIGCSAFGGCTRMTSIDLPNSVTNIEFMAFERCTSLVSISVDEGNLNFSSYEGVLFNKDKTTLIQYPAGKQGKYTIPNSVTSIGDGAFCYCSLPTVTIPNSVTSIGHYAFEECAVLTSIDIPNSVTSIGDGAFSTCDVLASIKIPNNVTSIGNSAFEYCRSLMSITIPNSVQSIGVEAFSNCSSLTSIEIPNSVTIVGDRAFYNCTGLTSATIGNSITRIGNSAFSDCTGLTFMVFEAETPPTLENGVFSNTNNCPIYVPCNTLDAYQTKWSEYSSRIFYMPFEYSITAQVDNEEAGSVQFPQNMCDSNIIIAIPNYGYHFVRWSDGSTENPRTIELTQDTTLIAEFAIAKSGTCGADNLLKWSYEDKTSTLTISGKGELTQNYTFGIEAPTQMKTLVIGDDVTSIGDSAFYRKTNINHLSIGGNVESIGNYAFAECKNFDDITCYANTVPTINATTFDNIGNKYYIYLFVPEERVRAYKRDTWWGQFDVQASSAKQTETTTVATTTTETAVEITWPSVTDAATYEVVIKDKAGNVVCTLIFDAEGKLISIAYRASSRDGAPQHTQTAGFSFTVTGLEPGTEYDLTITAKNEAGHEIDKKNSSFHTNWPNGIEDIHIDSDKPVKVLMDGRIYILRGEHVYDAGGKMVK